MKDFDFKIVLLCAFVVSALCYMNTAHKAQSGYKKESLIKYSKLNSTYYKASSENGLAVPITAQNNLTKHTFNTVKNANRILTQANNNSSALYTTSSARLQSYGGNAGGSSYSTAQNRQKTEQITSNAGIAHGFLAIATPVRHFDAKFADDNLTGNDIQKRATPGGGGAQGDDNGQSTVKLPLTTDKFVIMFMSILGAIYSLIKYKIVK
ncbi:MAG: hypothetical protein IJS73_05430 [Paludibacteraceae bacterium]|nr:hypothetical protein [Paludibacteraceae bacterium]